MNKKTVKDIDLNGKRVIMRVDFNVPMENGKIMDDTRILASIPTIKHVLDANAKLILMSHLGRPAGVGFEESFSLKPVAQHLTKILKCPVIMAPDSFGREVSLLSDVLQRGEVLLLENTRFHPEEVGKVETKGMSDDEIAHEQAEMKSKQERMARQLAELGDVYVNDAFGSAHRAHASTSVIARFMDTAVAGFLMEKELTFLGSVIENPERPFVAIIGGAKISGKLELLQNLIKKVDTLVIGGGMAYTFKKASGERIGKSIVENDLLDTARETVLMAKNAGKNLLLPVDNIVADDFSEDANTQISRQNIPDDWEGVDIGPDTIQMFSREIRKARTILWNGPMGCFEMTPFSNGTNAICQAVADADAISVIGGGDTVSAVRRSGLYDKMTHVSTGGGASLEFLEGKELPGVAALEDK